jgi:acyl-CoA synthetase (NDP forming)
MAKRPHWLLEPDGIRLLQAYGISYPRHGLAQDADEAAEIADQLGYPVVLKVVSPDVLHKSDAGGVAVGMEDAARVREMYGQILTAVRNHAPQAKVQGMLVCQQAAPGLEAIVGSLKDALFGPTLMFGLGGILVDVLQDVSFRIAPLKREDAVEMIQEIRGYPLLQGLRGQGPYDVEGLVDVLLKVSQMIVDRPDIEELDLNPVRVYERGVEVLDVRILTH